MTLAAGIQVDSIYRSYRYILSVSKFLLMGFLNVVLFHPGTAGTLLSHEAVYCHVPRSPLPKWGLSSQCLPLYFIEEGCFIPVYNLLGYLYKWLWLKFNAENCDMDYLWYGLALLHWGFTFEAGGTSKQEGWVCIKPVVRYCQNFVQFQVIYLHYECTEIRAMPEIPCHIHLFMASCNS